MTNKEKFDMLRSSLKDGMKIIFTTGREYILTPVDIDRKYEWIADLIDLNATALFNNIYFTNEKE